MSKRRSTKRKRSGKQRKNTPVFYKFTALVLAAVLGLSGYDYYLTGDFTNTIETAGRLGDYMLELPDHISGLLEEAKELIPGELGKEKTGDASSLKEIPEYNGEPYVIVNGNVPFFTEEEKNAEPYEFYSELDSLGRCGPAEAKISTGLMPTEERDSIGMVKPSGWHTAKYDMIEGKYLYNRCHLIGYQLTGENANERNLITGTRYLNVIGMLPWENMTADYIQETGDCVMYRVTPIYEGNDLVAQGVQMEAESLNSNEICFNIFVYNIQPGIGIDYSNGNSWVE